MTTNAATSTTPTPAAGPPPTLVIPPADPSIFARNLRALSDVSPATAESVRGVSPLPPERFCWHTAADGTLTATLRDAPDTPPRWLASRRGTGAEAAAWAKQIDLRSTGVAVVLGFGLGYHVRCLAETAAGTLLMLVFEPDVTLLRTVLERVDHSVVLGSGRVCIFTDPHDAAPIAAAAAQVEGLFALGTSVVDHPASIARLGDGAKAFADTFGRVLASIRVNVISTMTQTEATFRNLLQNLDHYALGGDAAGVLPLKDLFKGRPAIVVAAGPSLERNIEQLARPGVRDRFVIVAAQTVLKPLLARGIKPHFVTALDYHEISRRFYEGLTPKDVEGVTLVIEPKVNPAVPEAFPGPVRCCSNEVRGIVLGPELHPSVGDLPAGTTVAHLSYYLARYLGCDPVSLIGQDLGFTDGQYYAAGAAIHSVWAAELNPFNTLEMLEWQRIKRHSGMLRRATDVLGRPIYTDDQMATYLMQFQRDFLADKSRGLTTIDATEGGVRKEATTPRPLREVIDEELARPAPTPIQSVLAALPVPAAPGRAVRRKTVAQRLASLLRSTQRIAEHSRAARGLLVEAREHQADLASVARTIDRLDELRRRVTRDQSAWRLVNTVNQIGMFRRIKADRRINLDDALEPMERQRRQIERDLVNVEWLAESADALTRLLSEALSTLEGGAKVTRDPPAASIDVPGKPAQLAAVAAVVTLDLSFNGLGTPRDPAADILPGRTAFSLTLERLLRAKHVPRVTVYSTDATRARSLAGPFAADARVDFVTAPDGRWPANVRRPARLWAMHGWRGGLGNFTIYDEALDPAAAAQILESTRAEAALIVSGDWCLIDPALVDSLIERYREDPAAHRLTFCQAAPGLAPMVLDRRVIDDLRAGRPASGTFSSVGGLLGYIPTLPTPDLLARSMCVPVPAEVRDCPVRPVPDTPHRAAWLIEALRVAGVSPLTGSAPEIARAVAARAVASPPPPAHLTIVLPPGTTGIPAVDLSLLRQHITAHCAARSDTTVTVHAPRLAFPGWHELVLHACHASAGAVHLRTDLIADRSEVERLPSLPIDVISIDMIAELGETYTPLAGAGPDAYARSRAHLQWLGRAIPPDASTKSTTPWLVPRLTRRDDIYEQIESWYDHWVMMTGWAVIDPLPAPVPGARITPFPLPALAAARDSFDYCTVLPDGRAISGTRE